MSITTEAGSVYTIFGIDSIESVIDAVAGDENIEAYDAAVAAYQQELEDLLPEGWTIAGDVVYREVDAEDVDVDELREAARDISLDWALYGSPVEVAREEHEALAVAEREARRHRDRRDAAIRAARSAGRSRYSIARELGWNEQGVARVEERG